jgi:hypothetical protein
MRPACSSTQHFPTLSCRQISSATKTTFSQKLSKAQVGWAFREKEARIVIALSTFTLRGRSVHASQSPRDSAS